LQPVSYRFPPQGLAACVDDPLQMTMRIRALAALGAILALLGAAAAARAATIGISSTVSGGSTLSVATGSAPSFGITLNGIDQTSSYSLPLTIVDARGSGGGWNLAITSTSFDDGTGLGAGHTFPSTASVITGVSASCGSGSTCTIPGNNVANTSLTIPAGATAPAAVKFLNAQSSSGMGTINLTTAVNVTIPANVFAGTYTSTVTIAIAAGP
jgi:hypothetical protein